VVVASTFGAPAAAQTLVQTRDLENLVGTGTSLALAYAAPVVPGNTLIAVCRTGNSQGSVTLADSVNGAWTQALATNDPGNRSITIAYFASTGLGTPVVTCSWSPNATLNNQLTLFEYSGLSAATPFGGGLATCPNPVTSTPTSGSFYSSGTNDLLLGAVTIPEASTTAFAAEATGFTTESTDSFGVANHSHLHTADEIASAPGTYAYEPFLAAGEPACVAIAVFRTAGAAAPMVTTGPPTQISSTGVQLNGSANPNLTATTGWFRYDTVNPGVCDDVFGTRVPAASGVYLDAGASPIAYSQPVSGLTPTTPYYACAIADNAIGTSFGAVVSFQTLSAPDAGPPPDAGPLADAGSADSGSFQSGDAGGARLRFTVGCGCSGGQLPYWTFAVCLVAALLARLGRASRPRASDSTR